MKVLHFSISDDLDSASRAGLLLHRHLRARGVESRMLVKHRALSHDGCVETPAAEGSPDAEVFSIAQSFCFDSNAVGAISSGFEIGYPGVRIATHLEVSACDVIHLHQVAGFLSPLAIRELLGLGKPVLWSLPDAWPFTGGCFQPAGCPGFRDQCAQCPQLRDDQFHLPEALLADKWALLGGAENLTLLAPNAWLAQAARASSLFGGARIETVLPAAPEAKPITSDPARPLRYLFLFESPSSPAQGKATMQALLESAQTYGAFRSLVRSGKVELICLGIDDCGQNDLPVRCVRGENAEAVFTEADLLILPRVDGIRPAAFVQARAFGVPVVTFDEGGASEFIAHKTNGWLVSRFELRPLAEAVCYLASNPALAREMARNQAAMPVADDSVATTLHLYEALLAGKRGSVSAVPEGIRPELHARCDAIVRAVARQHIDERTAQPRDLQARLESAEKTLQGAEMLINEAQRNLTSIERRQRQLIDSNGLSEAAIKELQRAQKSVVSLRNKLKWRARRLKVFRASNPAPERSPIAQHADAPPEISAWARMAHRLFLKNHWMKHGKKDQYPPRLLRPEKFPAPKLRDADLPRIAIVTPSFMQGDFVEATIRSVIDQNYPNLAYTVQDGGSTDRTLEVIQRHADKITVWSSQPDSGQARAVASGFEKISGQVMAWVNSDDLFVAGALRFVGEFFATHPDVDAIYGHRIIINEHGQEIARWVLPPHNPRITPYVDPVPQETLFWRAALWEKVGGIDPSFRFALDWDLVERFQKAGANIVRVPYFLGCFRVHSQQKLSARAESIGAEEIAYVRQRETGHAVSFEELEPYKRWLEIHGAICSRLLELGIRI